jgi:hypothetical protein
MRFVGLAIFILVIPILAGLIKSNPQARRYSWIAVGAAPFVQGWLHTYVSIIPWPMWPGYVKGMMLALPDALALSTLIATKPRGLPQRAVVIAFSCYAAAAAVSIFFASVGMAAFFFVWQAARVAILAAAVGRIAVQESAPRYVVYGLAYGIIFQSLFSINERLHGVVQAAGTMGHQNLLGMMCHFSLLSCLGLMLAGDRTWTPRIGMFASFVVVILSGSRATIGFAAAGAVLLILLSLARRPTARKMRVAMLGLVGMTLAAPVAYLTLSERFAGAAGEETYDERAAFERAAKAILSDHPMGIGANNYVVIVNTGGYSARAGVAAISGSRSANVHNTFLLMAAETGYIGIAGFVCVLIVGAYTAVSVGWSKKPKFAYADLSLAIFITVLVISIHGKYEWILATEAPQYLLGIVLGMAAGLKQQRALQIRAARKTPPVRREMPLDDIAHDGPRPLPAE